MEKIISFIFVYMGLFCERHITKIKNTNLEKKFDRVFLGYAYPNVTYIFLVVKSKSLYVLVDTIIKSRDATLLRIYFL